MDTEKKTKGLLITADKEEMTLMLSDSNAGKLLKAMFAYNRGDVTAGDNFKGALKVAFMSFKNQADWCTKQYDKRCETNRINGSKGGRPRKQKTQKTEKNPKKPYTDTDTDTGTDTDTKAKAKAKADAGASSAGASTGFIRPTVDEKSSADTHDVTSDLSAQRPGLSSAATRDVKADWSARPRADDDDEERQNNALSAWHGVVMLSENQVGALLDVMEIEEFHYYLEKLADFIITKNARVKNHYKTILKWHSEDTKL